MNVRNPEKLNELIALAEKQAPDWDWAYCIACGSEDVVDRALYLAGSMYLARAGWCAARLCQADRKNPAGTSDIPEGWPL